ncbi:hypothetical protein [Roseibium suaedae]|uniref:Uncharacterized protein n=1 Tax=Roseibium suaedae TaxID=735517 RepID=A0A1M7J5P1_9HYPH|nr:hypothetical protein [Roseibium suaedae]SHM48409.1 hypothetical protein SAMN05444272_2739 [Roseibium suaedae]
MKSSDHDLTRQDEDMAPETFEAEENRDHKFGNWPELFGALFTLFVIWLTFAFTG